MPHTRTPSDRRGGYPGFLCRREVLAGVGVGHVLVRVVGLESSASLSPGWCGGNEVLVSSFRPRGCVGAVRKPLPRAAFACLCGCVKRPRTRVCVRGRLGVVLKLLGRR